MFTCIYRVTHRNVRFWLSLLWFHFGFNACYCTMPRCHLNCEAATAVIDYSYVDICIDMYFIPIAHFYIKTLI